MYRFNGKLLVNRSVMEIPKRIKSKELPAEYRRLNYIENTGQQYINTGIDSGGLIKHIITYDIQIMTNSTRMLHGYESTSHDFWGVDASNNYEGTSKIAGDRDIIIWTYDKVNGISKIVFGDTLRTMGSPSSHQNDFSIFRITNTSWYLKAKLYECSIYSDETPLRYFIPALRISDSKPGLYDLVTETFFVNGNSRTDFSYN